MAVSKKYQGVTSNNGTFKAQIGRRGKIFYLGNYPTELKAAQMYDRAHLLTVAYANSRNQRTNLDGSERPDEEFWTEWEREMMTWLRTYHPQDEKRYAETVRGEEFLPDTVLRNNLNMVDRTKSFSDVLFAHLDDVASSLRMSASTMAEMKATIEWQRGALQAAEARVRELEGMGNLAPTKIVFRKVIPPAVPVTHTAPIRERDKASEVPAVSPQEVPAMDSITLSAAVAVKVAENAAQEPASIPEAGHLSLGGGSDDV